MSKEKENVRMFVMLPSFSGGDSLTRDRVMQLRTDLERYLNDYSEAMEAMDEAKGFAERQDHYEDAKFLAAGIRNLHTELWRYVDREIDRLYQRQLDMMGDIMDHSEDSKHYGIARIGIVDAGCPLSLSVGTD
jgi:hypothetical protein